MFPVNAHRRCGYPTFAIPQWPRLVRKSTSGVIISALLLLLAMGKATYTRWKYGKWLSQNAHAQSRSSAGIIRNFPETKSSNIGETPRKQSLANIPIFPLEDDNINYEAYTYEHSIHVSSSSSTIQLPQVDSEDHQRLRNNLIPMRYWSSDVEHPPVGSHKAH